MSALHAAFGFGLALALATDVAAQGDMRSEQVRFEAEMSSTMLDGSITGHESVLYKIGAEAGQQMTVRLKPSNRATYFNVYTPGSGTGDAALVSSRFTGATVPDLNVFEGALPVSGTYTVSVYMMRSAARRGEVSDYTLAISVDGALGQRVEADYADGLRGGPDVYQVATPGMGPLNLRSGPTLEAEVVTQLANGRNLRNLGCRMAQARRWCRVATLSDAVLEGWVAGEFLIEGTNDPLAGVSD